MTNKLRIISMLGALAGFLTIDAWAQTNPESEFTPKNYSIVDQNGVDLAQRSFSVGHSISIGDPANGGMSYSANYSSWTWWHHRSVMAFVRNDNLTDSETGSTASVLALYYGGNSEAMNWTGSGYAGDLGSSMTGCGSSGCIATLSDGTVLTFQTAPTSISYTADIYLLTTALKPSGERLNYYYVPGSYAIQAITNNYGYQLRFFGTWQQPSSVVLFNMAVDPCSPSAASCTFSRTWPRLSFEYSASRVSAVVETDGARTNYGYGPVSQLLEEIDGPGTADVSIRYQDCGPLPPNGRCNAGGEVVGGFRVNTVAKGGRTWSYSWDPALTNAQNPEHGVRVTNAAGYAGYRTAITTSFGNSMFDIYPIADRIIAIRDELSRTTSMEYAGQLNPRVSKVTFPEGNGAQYVYDQRMNVSTIRKFAKPGSGQADEYTYIERAESGDTTSCIQAALCNKPLRVRDPRGYVTRYTWNPTSGQMLSSERGLEGPSSGLTCALGPDLCPKESYGYAPLSAYFYDASGQMAQAAPISVLTSISKCENYASCGSGEQIVTTLGYGAPSVANNLLVRTVTSGKASATRTTSYDYDAVGNRIRVDGPRSDVADITWFAWDLDRRPTDQVFADGSATRRGYSSEGYLATLSKGTSTGIGQFTAYEVTANEYDGGGNLKKIITPTGVTQKSYDGAGRLTCTVQRMNPAVFGSLPDDACTLSAQGPNGADRITRNIYDAAGQVTAIQRAYNTTLAQTYASYAYTLNGKQDWVQDANGNRSDFSYDGFDRLVQLNFPSATLGANAPNPSDYEQYGYDANGNRTTLRLRSGETVVYSFDALNREWLQDFPSGISQDVYSGYDLLGRLLYARHQSASGQGVDYSYDAWDGVLSEAAYGRTLAFAYDTAGNRTRLTWPDLNYVEYSYDLMNRMDQVRENGATSGAGLLADYAYDVLGRRSGLTRGNGTTATWGYDSGSRLSALTQDLAGSSQDLALGFSYNSASQILARTLSNDVYQYAAAAVNRAYTPDGLNRYSSFTYDLRGNLVNNGTRAFTYDLDNHLVRVDAAGGSPTQLTLSYDPRGRLKQTAGATTTQYLYAGDQLVAEFDAAGTLTRRYVHGASVDEPLVWYEGAALSTATRQWLHSNHQGSIVGVSGSTGGLQGAAYSYSAYGEPDVAHGWSGSRFRFTGQIALPEVELYFYKARVYDPALGRFLQTDPIGYKDDTNLYAYVGNDPINKLDPSGMEERKVLQKEDVAKIVTKAKESKESSTATAVGIFKDLPENSTVSGSTINSAISDAGVELNGTAKGLLANADTINKTGSKVEISNSSSSTVQLPDNKTLTIGKSVEFKVGTVDGKPTISNIKGLTADVGLKVTIKQIQVVPGGIDVSASKGIISITKHIDLPE